MNRFAVVDHRSKKELDAEQNIQKHLEKAMRTARSKRKLAEQKARDHEERMKMLAEQEALKLAARYNGEESSDDEENDLNEVGNQVQVSSDVVTHENTSSVARYHLESGGQQDNEPVSPDTHGSTHGSTHNGVSPSQSMRGSSRGNGGSRVGSRGDELNADHTRELSHMIVPYDYLYTYICLI